MTALTHMPMINDAKKQLAFSRPAVGKRAYVSRGPSGWPETFDRTAADKALATFINPLDLTQLITDFWIRVDIDQVNTTQHETWDQVMSHLAHNMGIESYKDIPEEVGVAFWGNALVSRYIAIAN